MGKQLNVYLDEQEIKRLAELSQRECRRPVDQVRYLLREALGLTETDVQSVGIANRDALDSDPRRATAA